MFTQTNGTSPTMSRWIRLVPWLLLPVMLLSISLAHAQQLTGTLSGIVVDQTDARIPGASITVKNNSTGDLRTSTADSSGFWSVTALIPGNYNVIVSAQNFAKWELNGIVVNQGDSRTVPNIRLKIGSEATAVTVISGQDAEIPVDSAEVSATLNNELVDTATLTGRNAAELIKMMPGVVFNNQGGVGSAYNSTTTGTNNGPAGSFSANGTQPYGSTDVYLDGANLIDPGNAGTQVANINQDMTDSIKYLAASYGAEYAKGPAVLQAFSKSGGQKFHGEGYVYARNSATGFANDWNQKLQQELQGKHNAPYPSHFYYIGGNIGGPVFFPHFNHNRDKLFFWAGYENMRQNPYNQPAQMNVPTDAQLNGDFSNTGVPQGVLQNQQYAYATPCAAGTGWQECSNAANAPWGTATTGLNKWFDPVGVTISKLNPKANETPSAGNGWNNFIYAPNTPVNRWEATGKVTYAFSDNTKLWGSFAYQSETDHHPLSIWWEPAYAIPYPGDPNGKETANVYLVNFTHAFSATTTNETVFAYAKFVNNNSLSNPGAVSRTTLGLPATSIFGATKATMPDFFDSWAGHGSTDIRELDFDGGIYGKNSFGKTSTAPSIADTFTKIIKTHSVKAGFYWDAQENLQSDGSWYGNGEFDVSPWSSASTNNLVLDRLIGSNAQYFEHSKVPVPDELWHQWSIWGQDSWKATRKLTLNIGLRADHMGQWYNKLGDAQVWMPSEYVNTPKPPANTGLSWRKLDSKIPTSGFSSPIFYYSPRLGVAYDVFGTGRTVVRAGFGTFHYQISDNAGSAMIGPLGAFDFNTGSVSNFFGYNVGNGQLYKDLAHTQTTQLTVPGSLNQTGSTNDIVADTFRDDKVPYADTYSLGVAQALPGHTVAEFSYVGSLSRNQLITAQSQLLDKNIIPIGSFFQPDPNPYSKYAGKAYNPSPIGSSNPGDWSQNDWRPLHNYQHVKVFQHLGYANYNSLQVSAQKQSGNLYLFTNFTFGKVLGTRDGDTSNGNGNGNVVNPFNLADNYGPLPYDHTKVFNLSFTYKLPKPVHNNRLLEGAVNGWELSNYTTYQDGSNLQAANPVLNATYTTDASQPAITMPNGMKTQAIQQQTWFGTSDFPNALLPMVVCDPRKGLLRGQRFNPNCFAAPLPPTATTVGQQGQWIWPYLRNPSYFGSDLAVFKAFRINDSQRIEARISATNWLNHPNAGFNLNGNSDNYLNFFGYSDGSSLRYNTNASTTGIPAAKQGYRWMQFSAKYYF